MIISIALWLKEKAKEPATATHYVAFGLASALIVSAVAIYAHPQYECPWLHLFE